MLILSMIYANFNYLTFERLCLNSYFSTDHRHTLGRMAQSEHFMPSTAPLFKQSAIISYPSESLYKITSELPIFILRSIFFIIDSFSLIALSNLKLFYDLESEIRCKDSHFFPKKQIFYRIICFYGIFFAFLLLPLYPSQTSR